MNKVKLITIVKNRLDHFLKSFPFMVSQYGVEYDFVVVDYHSNDDLYQEVLDDLNFRKDTFSPFLNSIQYIHLTPDLKFNSKKARNLGASYFLDDDCVLSFCDVDTFPGMSYLSYWSKKVVKGRSFVATRIQESMASSSSRLSHEVNYGNYFVHSQDYREVGGCDESMDKWGGGDDDVYHRLKLSGLREINPYDSLEARQYSIIHGDDLRLGFLENSARANPEETFKKIYSNLNPESPESNFLIVDDSRSNLEILYEK